LTTKFTKDTKKYTKKKDGASREAPIPTLGDVLVSFVSFVVKLFLPSAPDRMGRDDMKASA
jgi:hypothetical protein